MDPIETSLRQAWHDLQEVDFLVLQAISEHTGEEGFSPRQTLSDTIKKLTLISVALDHLKTQIKD